MKRLILLFSFISLLMNVVKGQVFPSTTENYIVSTKYMDKNGQGKAMHSIQYYDGLGRPNQMIKVAASPIHTDIISLQEYDNLGRESKAWLPIPHDDDGNEGAYVSTSELNFLSKNQYKDQSAFSYPVYENSPLNRVVKQYGPGQEWQNPSNDKYIGTQYLTNNSSDSKLNCTHFKVNHSSNGQVSLSRDGNYTTGELFVMETKDENGNLSYEFKDKLGQVILTRQINSNNNYDTYYVYDDFGNLCYVLPPILSDKIIKEGKPTGDTGTEMKQYAYIYKYDHRNRCIEKRLPGCEPVYFVYDKTDRLILSQDGEQRNNGNKWSFTKYDGFGRVIMTGEQAINTSHESLRSKYKDIAVTEKALADNPGPPYGYTWNSLSEVNYLGVLTVNYYDHYWLLEQSNPHFRYDKQNGYGEWYNPNGSVHKGLLTATREKYLDGSGESITFMYYDERGRVIQTKSTNHLGGLDKEYTGYNFIGQPVKKKVIHTGSYLPSPYVENDVAKYFNGELVEEYTYSYDHAGRLKETIRNGKTIESLTYNELGQLSNKKQDNVLANNYEYNIRGWMKKHTENKTRFEQALYYTEATSERDKNYNGNISYMTYKQGDDLLVKNSYIYDGLSRMSQSTASIIAPGYSYIVNEEYMEYDKHGNIKYLTRGTNNGWTDMLSLTYKGNQLSSLSNEYPDINGVNVVEYPKETGSFGYNANGALISDSGRGIVVIQYNSLNLPKLIQFKNGNQIHNTYSADGTKLRTKHITAKQGVVQPITNGQVRVLENSEIQSVDQTDYVGNIIVRSKDDGNPAIECKVLFGGGYEEYTRTQGTDMVYLKDTRYQLRDYLGNIRSTTNLNNRNLEVTEYQAFGAPFRRFKGEMSSDPYKFGGKEFDRMHGLDWYDFHARQYDPVLSRFHTIDPLAEKYYSISPYVYCVNNPLKYIDPDGKDVIVLNDPQSGKGQGHTAILVGNESKGWTYISKDGTQDKWYSNYLTGGPSKVGQGYFKSIDDFNKSEYAKDYNGFPDRVRFLANNEQDKKAINVMLESSKSWYHVTLNNCADAVSDALIAIGLNPGYRIYGIDNPYADPAYFKDPRPTNRLEYMKEFNMDRIIPLDNNKKDNTESFDLTSFINAVIAAGGTVTIK